MGRFSDSRLTAEYSHHKPEKYTQQLKNTCKNTHNTTKPKWHLSLLCCIQKQQSPLMKIRSLNTPCQQIFHLKHLKILHVTTRLRRLKITSRCHEWESGIHFKSSVVKFSSSVVRVPDVMLDNLTDGIRLDHQMKQSSQYKEAAVW